MTIRHRITLLVVLTFFALSAIGAYAVYQTRKSASEVRQVTQGIVPSALASADLVADVKNIQIATMTLVYAPDANTAAQARDELKAKQAALRAALDAQAKSAVGRAQEGLVAQAKDSATNYFAAIDDTVKMKTDGKAEMAQAYLFANVAQYRDELESIVDTLRVEKNRQKDDAIGALNGMLATTATAIAGVAGTVIVLLTALGFVLYRQITRPLIGMQTAMSEIATSQDFTRRVPVGRMDEIGHSIVAFNGMIEKIQENAAQLKQKTADIQAMLQNMQQGILTVVEGGVVHAEYSAYLETIFETNDIAGRDLMALVFDDSAIGADARSQVDAAVHACLGEDSMNFAFNEHLLVNEVAKRMPDGREKWLDLSWSAITDETDTVVRLMLCVRDVTEIRELTAQAGEQQRRLEMIGEILSISQDKFHDFVHSAKGFLSENERMIRQHERADHSIVAALFRNMHTIKGNARTYSLQHLTNIVHEAEQAYESLRRADSGPEWNRDALMEDLARVREAVDHYATINAVTLGRGGEPAQHGADYLMVERAHISESLRVLDGADPANASDWHAAREAVRRMLSQLGTQGIGDALGGVIESLPSLAAELGKPAPVVHIDSHGQRVRSEIVATLKNVFMHLLRNAIDHGIESSDERRAAGKAASGTIDIAVGVGGGELWFVLGDDGRGLALDRIRGIARERGWLDADSEAALSDEEVAELIFRPGFSTARTVTEVSGRGVGMDAVRNFLKRDGGDIALRFTDDRVGAPYRAFETIVSLPARFAADDAAHAQRARIADIGAAE
ncbi:MCP four helix bundle domain-containing protein [Burkholderia cenocepacia]|uniref:Chemotaxis protein CheA n=2 Tax=Burkholderia cenocepacia TaxID=95486 RepID=A0A1V2W4S0_9BURK|nr:MCP four helix bundle domain-containing protein [Burkholderia cenocepacia]MBR8249410.1 MCP four helix bundle domain-containing protein [Burkholderia cenocepacia]MBR8288941.1 MCP four helix bundle domain-containing protein [Burkholderia cenocepacia]MDR8037745.1 MCP four helix bundle domain-containing protein [Burkholderia cenocepacia]ONI99427.1 chemotaxis protein CheA [Burkholderia cenocepacia]ONJ22011.1 chemotaxis protein CheA [Burkholderia cenocepacia]